MLYLCIHACFVNRQNGEIVTLNNIFLFVDLQNNLEFYNLLCLNFVQGLKYKLISAQEPRLKMRYKSLIRITLDLGLVRLKMVELVKIN
jgi:hypothetical protein